MKRVVRQSRSKSPSRALRAVTDEFVVDDTRSGDESDELDSPRAISSANVAAPVRRHRRNDDSKLSDPLHYELVHTRVAQSALTTSELDKTSMFGVINLCALLLVVHNLRLVVENLIKYGWLYGSFVSHNFGFLINYDDVVCLVCLFFVVVVPPLVLLFNERLLVQQRITLDQNRYVALFTCAATLVVPTLTILSLLFFKFYSLFSSYHSNNFVIIIIIVLDELPWPYISSILMLFSVVIAMKVFLFTIVSKICVCCVAIETK
jgi:hypothetical protein